MPILNKVLDVLGVDEVLFSHDEHGVQGKLAPSLRQKAIQHLEQGGGVVARSFRGEYIKTGMGAHTDFLAEQSKKGTWGTYIEATALGELIGCNVVVTPVKDGIEQKPICLYRAADPKALTVHLYNDNNTHWYVNERTMGNGDCLYNAFAQGLQTLVRPELKAPGKLHVTRASHHHDLISETAPKIEKTVQEIIRQQRHIENCVSKYPAPVEKEAEFIAEKNRIEQLPDEEKAQIALDYQIALKFAYEDMGYANKNIFDVAPQKKSYKELYQDTIRLTIEAADKSSPTPK